MTGLQKCKLHVAFVTNYDFLNQTIEIVVNE